MGMQTWAEIMVNLCEQSVSTVFDSYNAQHKVEYNLTTIIELNML